MHIAAGLVEIVHEPLRAFSRQHTVVGIPIPVEPPHFEVTGPDPTAVLEAIRDMDSPEFAQTILAALELVPRRIICEPFGPDPRFAARI